MSKSIKKQLLKLLSSTFYESGFMHTINIFRKKGRSFQRQLESIKKTIDFFYSTSDTYLDMQMQFSYDFRN